MIRWTRVIDQKPDSITLQPEQRPQCAGCVNNCNQPLFRLFGSHDHQITINSHAHGVQLTNPDRLFNRTHEPNSRLGLHIDDGALLSSAFGLYGVPLLLMLMGMAVLAGMSEGLGLKLEAAVLFGWLLGVVSSVWVLKSKRLRAHLKISPKVTILDPLGTSVS